MHLPKAMLFDLDGTLIDSTEIVVDAYYTGMQKLGYSPKNREYIASLGGRSTFDTGRGLGIKEEDLHAIDAHFWNFFGEYARREDCNTPLFPGVRQLVQYLHEQGVKMGIVTSNEAKNAELLMAKADLQHYFSAYAGRETTKARKPDPEPIYYILSQLQIHPINPDTVWLVGDTYYDVQGAKNAGIKAVGIVQSHTDELMLKAEPDLVFSSIMDLYKFIVDI